MRSATGGSKKAGENRESFDDRLKRALEAEKRLRDPVELHQALRGFLLLIACGDGGSAACRAIEALLGMPAPVLDDEVDDSELEILERSAVEFLRLIGYQVKKLSLPGGAKES